METENKPKPDWNSLLDGPKITCDRVELATALAAAQAEIDAAPKSESNPFFKSSYADLATVRAVIRDAFGKHGLSVVQIPQTRQNQVLVTTILMHKSGQFIEGTLALTPVKSDPQAIGSAITYARRYSLMAFAGVAPDDDDGNAASHSEAPRQQQRKPAASSSQKAPPPRRQEPPPPMTQQPKAKDSDDEHKKAIDALKETIRGVGDDVTKAEADAVLQMAMNDVGFEFGKQVRSKGVADTAKKLVEELAKRYPKHLNRIAKVWKSAVSGGMDPTDHTHLYTLVKFVTKDMNMRLEQAVSDELWKEFYESLTAEAFTHDDSLMRQADYWQKEQKEALR